MRIAVFGGAFNPVHREHIHLARLAVKELKLDKIIIMPSAISPHKSGKLSVDFWHRYECCRIAFADIPQLLSHCIAQRRRISQPSLSL